jgi:hypothetical protein
MNKWNAPILTPIEIETETASTTMGGGDGPILS